MAKTTLAMFVHEHTLYNKHFISPYAQLASSSALGPGHQFAKISKMFQKPGALACIFRKSQNSAGKSVCPFPDRQILVRVDS